MMVFDCTTSAIRLSRKNFSFGWNVIYCRQVCNAAAAAATVYTMCSTDLDLEIKLGQIHETHCIFDLKITLV